MAFMENNVRLGFKNINLSKHALMNLLMILCRQIQFQEWSSLEAILVAGVRDCQFACMIDLYTVMSSHCFELK